MRLTNNDLPVFLWDGTDEDTPKYCTMPYKLLFRSWSGEDMKVLVRIGNRLYLGWVTHTWVVPNGDNGLNGKWMHIFTCTPFVCDSQLSYQYREIREFMVTNNLYQEEITA